MKLMQSYIEKRGLQSLCDDEYPPVDTRHKESQGSYGARERVETSPLTIVGDVADVNEG